MDNALFCKSFFFTEFSRRSGHHTDNSCGISCNFIGRMLQGRARIVSEQDGTLELHSGDVFYFPLGMRYHSYWYTDRGSVRFESYRFDFYPSEDSRRFSLQKLFPSAEELALLDLVAADMRVSPLSVGRLLSFFGTQMPRMALAEPDPKKRLLAEARKYIADCKDFKVSGLARHLGMSESGVYAFFRGLGKTPIEVKNDILAERAVRLLCSTDLSVEQIADRVGFSSVAYFRKLIYSKFGKTPREIRLDGTEINKL